ncbi:hypothetical protein [Streptomyces albicerus]|nr:hypothetical protein [Streptomyces albicerus]
MNVPSPAKVSTPSAISATHPSAQILTANPNGNDNSKWTWPAVSCGTG